MIVKFSFFILLGYSTSSAMSKEENHCTKLCVSAKSCTRISNNICIDQASSKDNSKCELICEKSFEIDPKLSINSNTIDPFSTETVNDIDSLISLIKTIKALSIFEEISNLIKDDPVKKGYSTKYKYTWPIDEIATSQFVSFNNPKSAFLTENKYTTNNKPSIIIETIRDNLEPINQDQLSSNKALSYSNIIRMLIRSITTGQIENSLPVLANILDSNWSKENNIDKNNGNFLNKLKDYSVLMKLSDVETERPGHANEKVDIDLMNFMELLRNSPGFNTNNQKLSNNPYFKKLTTENDDTEVVGSSIKKFRRLVKRNTYYGATRGAATFGAAGEAAGYRRSGRMRSGQNGGLFGKKVEGGFTVDFGRQGVKTNQYGNQIGQAKGHDKTIKTQVIDSRGLGGYGLSGFAYGRVQNYVPTNNVRAEVLSRGNAGAYPYLNAGSVMTPDIHRKFYMQKPFY